ncbi:MAG TPA: hypothetical protein VHZ50_17010 [Puia sp.]|jgi:hypothetical protein|nr:hypothetical protein [Puia sp.]
MRERFIEREVKFIIRKLMLIPLVLLGVAFFSWVVMLLWNNVLAQVVHVSIVNFWQALGLLVLSKILFGGFRGARWGRNEWKKGMMKRWDGMTPEEKEKFRGEWEKRCGRRFGRPFEQEVSKSE